LRFFGERNLDVIKMHGTTIIFFNSVSILLIVNTEEVTCYFNS